MQIVEGVRDRDRIHDDLRIGLCLRQRVRAGRVDEAVDHDVGDMHAVLGIFLGEDLGEGAHHDPRIVERLRSEEHTSELQSLMRISYAVFCLKKKNKTKKVQKETDRNTKIVRQR